jgi:ribA/ribD-fused uncharacterized protein
MEYHFFYGGNLSQWCRNDGFGGPQFEVEEIEYNCAEQYMMAMKASLFGDEDAFHEIMSLYHPREQKAAGRKVRGFDNDKWQEVARDFVYRANWAKFTQNKGLELSLQDTGDAMLVEASPYDKIWGIGIGVLEAQDSNVQPAEWKGTNWLGQVLTKVREDMRADKKDENIDWDKIPWS